MPTPARLRILLSASLLWLAGGPLAAQSSPRGPAPAAVRRAALTITDSDVRRRIAVIADDSMRGRPTPSRELDRTAAYIAEEFRRFGLRPGGDSGTFIQRYPILRVQLDTASFVTIAGHGVEGRWTMGQDLAPGAPLPIAADVISGPVVLLKGMPSDTARPFGRVPVRGAVVVQTLPRSMLMRGSQLVPLLAKAAAAGVRGWIVVLPLPRSFVAFQVRTMLAPQLVFAGRDEEGPVRIPVLLMRDSSAFDVLRAAGEDPVALRDTATRDIRALGGFRVTLSARRRVIEELSAPNVIGVLEGSDPRLRDEFVLFSAHMDHIGVTRGDLGCIAAGADSICNGADDNASGTSGVVELAEAFATLTPRPRRSLIFLAVSGEERDLWGSGWYTEHPAVPLAQTVADLNMDMIGRNWRDTIAVIGKEHSSLGEVADRVAQDHPELNVRLIGDIWPTEDFYRRSDHFNFARRGVPILFFFNGVHPDYHRPTDSPDRIDAEKEARIVRMVFYIGLEVANAAQRPAWNPESRRQIVRNRH